MNAFYYNYLMQAISHYASPLGKILITADDAGVTGLWFQDQPNAKPAGGADDCRRVS